MRLFETRLFVAVGLLSAGFLWSVAAQDEGGEKPVSVQDTPPPRLKLESAAPPSVAIDFDSNLLRTLVQPRPAIAVDGKDVVAQVTTQQVEDGRRDQTSEFDGQTYQFSSESNKTLFDNDPARYAPVLSGFSVVAFKDGGKLVPGSAEYSSNYGDRLYLFASPEEKQSFDADPAAFEDVDLLLQGFSPVSLMEEELLRRGDKEYEVIFEGRRIRPANAEEMELFMGDPSAYFPSLGGLDPISVADGKPEFGLARYSVEYKNRLYSMASEENRERFLANAEPHSDLDVADDGRDPVALVDERVDRQGHYGIGAVYRGQRFLFSNAANREKFVQDPSRYVRERSRAQSNRG